MSETAGVTSKEENMLEKLGRVVEDKVRDMTSGDYSLNYRGPAGRLGSEEVARAIIEELMEMDGQMWITGRGAFVIEGEKYQKADRYEMASAIADRAPENILRAMLQSILQSKEEGEGR